MLSPLPDRLATSPPGLTRPGVNPSPDPLPETERGNHRTCLACSPPRFRDGLTTGVWSGSRAPPHHAAALRLRIGDAPDPVGAVVGDQERAVAGHEQAHGAAPDVSVARSEEPPGQEVFVSPNRLPVLEAHADDL